LAPSDVFQIFAVPPGLCVKLKVGTLGGWKVAYVRNLPAWRPVVLTSAADGNGWQKNSNDVLYCGGQIKPAQFCFLLHFFELW
jgi:hypothetical protein